MKLIFLNSVNPCFNLACEEYLLKNCNEEYFMLWQNESSIIVGRNQNTYSEINYEYVKKHSIPVVRRLTGGGAVFHDIGNLNYTFIKNDEGVNFGNYKYFAQPIIDVLKSEYGVKAELSGRNDMLIDGKKFSGNAQTSWHGRTMHHGTLMFNASVGNMSEALHVNPLKIQSKGIKSVRSRVTNINEHVASPILITDFCNRILDKRKKLGDEFYELTEQDKAKITELQISKYQTDDWNFGFKKTFSFSKDSLFSNGIIQIRLNISNDRISEAEINGDFFGIYDVNEFTDRLIGVKYNQTDILKYLSSIDIEKYFSGIKKEELVSAMF